jgi:uncharacterized protein YchJ
MKDRRPQTAEALMRSRCDAFSREDSAYIKKNTLDGALFYVSGVQF